MDKAFLLSLLLIFSIQGCEKRENSIIKKGIVKLALEGDLEDRSIKLSEVIEHISYIPLETTESCIIGNINKIITFEDNFFILDSDITKSIYCFDKIGRFLFKIDKVGKGPGEYISPDDFIVDKNNNTVVVYSSQQREVLVYDFQGNFVKKNSLDFYASFFEKVGNLFVFYADYKNNSEWLTDSLYNLIVTDSKGKILNKYLPYSSNINSTHLIGYNRNFFNVDNGAILFSQYNDTIYQLMNNGQLRIKYLLDYGNQQKPKLKDLFDNKLTSLSWSYEDTNEFLQENEIAYLIDMVESKYYSYVVYRKKNTFHITFYSRKTGQIIEGARKHDPSTNEYPIPILNDIDPIQFYPIQSASETALISYFQPYEVESLQRGEGMKSEFSKVLEQISMNSNPVLTILHFKEF